jgi:hypothetical protein
MRGGEWVLFSRGGHLNYFVINLCSLFFKYFSQSKKDEMIPIQEKNKKFSTLANKT